MNVFMLIFIYLPVVIITAITPYITRKTESFGVTIPSDMYEDPRFRNFRSSYAKRSILLGVVFVLVLGILERLVDENVWILIFTVSVFAYLIATFIIYYQFHKKMKEIKEAEKWFEKKKKAITVDMNFRRKKITYSNAWFLIPFAIAITTLIFTLLHQDDFPDRLPMHYNFQGEVTDWADKSLGILLMFPLLQLFFVGLFLFINYTIVRSKQLVDPANPEESVMQNMIFRRRWSLFNIVTGTLLVIMFGLTQLSFVYDINPQTLFVLTMVLTGIILIGSIILTYMTGQGGSRVKIGRKINGEVIQRDDDQYWKLGIFYYNTEDPALWVEKRFGSGWTMNIARPTAWLILLGILIIPFIIYLLAR